MARAATTAAGAAPVAPARRRRRAGAGRRATADRAATPRAAGGRTTTRRAIRVVPRGGAGTRPAAALGTSLLDRLLRGRAWIAFVGVLLVGVVFVNVSLLEMNRGITRATERASALKRENADLRLRVARLASSERIQRAAAERGFVLPAPGDVRYLRADRGADARQAARRIAPPSGGDAPPAQPQAGAPAATGPNGQGGQAGAPGKSGAPAETGAPAPAGAPGQNGVPAPAGGAPAAQPDATAPGHSHPPAAGGQQAGPDAQQPTPAGQPAPAAPGVG